MGILITRVFKPVLAQSVDVTAEFNLNDTSAINDELNLSAKAVIKEGSYH